ncbi:MAG: DNA/RNA nuclease SfsA [Clostridia bacterium]|nr:DNA/RNA nuclease SfsA [Clostridia bacterium]
MKYDSIYTGVFLERQNRFVARVEMDGREERVHVKNTGRCAELLVPGNRVYLEKSDAVGRKTAYDLVAVEKRIPEGVRLVNMDSMAPNLAAREWLESGALGSLQNLRAEATIGDSRFDFCAEQDGRRVVIEVKGCTLEEDGVARFPDAPTERGVKHVRGLIELAKQGCRCVILIVIQMKGVRVFRPNWETHPAFGEALLEAQAAGVEVIAVDCKVVPGNVNIDRRISVDLTKR